MSQQADNAKNRTMRDFDAFVEHIRKCAVSASAKNADDYVDFYFHGMNADEWRRAFADWLTERVRKSTEVRASND